ncbi:MAG: exo-alpha-sialidase, partial [Planctomycetes bacterium]|nr:exo-alpha-sialidase [Planctomycetota bacterium]
MALANPLRSLGVAIALGHIVFAGDAPMAKLIEVRKIWDQAPHNAFTDLIRFKDRWFCAFREGKGHVCDTGKLRVLTSPDGQDWKSVALMAWDGGDVRDAKLSVTADGQLMLNGAVRFIKPVAGHVHQSVTWLSPNGEAWGEPNRVADPNFWMWSVTWHKGVGYGIGYSCTSKHLIRLYHTKDGKKWDPLADDLFPGGTYANETSLVFAPDDACYCLLRRDNKPSSAQLGAAKPPYTQWAWKDLRVTIGGPKMIRLPDGRFLATVRLYDKKVRTALCTL